MLAAHPRLRRSISIGVPVILFVAAAIGLRQRFPSLSAIVGALTGVDAMWLIVAAAAELLSLAMFGRQHRRLLKGFGVSISLWRASAISWSRSAIAISMPAGTAVSAGFAFQQFRAVGASRPTAATVMVVSNTISSLSFFALYATGLLASLVRPFATEPAEVVAAIGLGIAAVAAVIGVVLTWHARPHGRTEHLRAMTWLARWPRVSRVFVRLGETVVAAREVPVRHWGLAFGAAALNWLADLGCLIAVVHAFDLPVTLTAVALAYLGVQVVRQIPLTPGGLGLIEASLVAALVAGGSPYGGAAAAVLVYRLLSCWLVIPVGALAWAVLRRRTPKLPAPEALPEAEREPALVG